jgi:peptidoglycan/LPS O-acetylase OafA/YrhL
MATIDHPIPAPVADTGDVKAIRRLAAASVVGAALAIVSIGWATATRNHAFWAFALWVGFTVAAVATGLVALARLPRRRDARPLRRLAVLGVVGGVLCATLGLAVYSASRTDDCPTDRACTIPAPGSGQREQQP